jgi:hypothetical protein
MSPHGSARASVLLQWGNARIDAGEPAHARRAELPADTGG